MKKNKLIIYGAVVLLVLIVLGAGYYYSFMKFKCTYNLENSPTGCTTYKSECKGLFCESSEEKLNCGDQYGVCYDIVTCECS